MPERTWTCTRQAGGQKCRTVNPRRLKRCAECGKPRPASVGRTKAGVSAIDETYEQYVQRCGESCGICGRTPADGVRLVRDHDHATGTCRGLLCEYDNRRLAGWMRAGWLSLAAHYLRQYEAPVQDEWT